MQTALLLFFSIFFVLWQFWRRNFWKPLFICYFTSKVMGEEMELVFLLPMKIDDFSPLLNCWVCGLAWNSKFDILDGKSGIYMFDGICFRPILSLTSILLFLSAMAIMQFWSLKLDVWIILLWKSGIYMFDGICFLPIISLTLICYFPQPYCKIYFCV